MLTSITDIARYKNSEEPKDVVKNWFRSRNTIEFLSLWEKLNNPNLKGIDFDPFIAQAGSHSFTMSPQKWILKTKSIGIISRSGKNGGTFAHPDIAFKFASWISVEFKLYLIKEFERLKTKEMQERNSNWNLRRELTKINYLIHTDAIKYNLIPCLSEIQKKFVYADEADVLNVALFGITAKEWKNKNPNLTGNIRDYASILQLVILINLENLNAEMISNHIIQEERLIKLNSIARNQMKILNDNNSIKKMSKENVTKLNI